MRHFLIVSLLFSLVLYVISITNIFRKKIELTEPVRQVWLWLIVLIPILGSFIYLLGNYWKRKIKRIK